MGKRLEGATKSLLIKRHSNMLPDLIRDLLEDTDPFGYISAGSFCTIYDKHAELIAAKLSKDLSIVQIENVIWDVFYQELCICSVPGSEEPWVLDKEHAAAIIGQPSRFMALATTIRTMMGY
jgi:hypothetical protein